MKENSISSATIDVDRIASLQGFINYSYFTLTIFLLFGLSNELVDGQYLSALIVVILLASTQFLLRSESVLSWWAMIAIQLLALIWSIVIAMTETIGWLYIIIIVLVSLPTITPGALAAYSLLREFVISEHTAGYRSGISVVEIKRSFARLASQKGRASTRFKITKNTIRGLFLILAALMLFIVASKLGYESLAIDDEDKTAKSFTNSTILFVRVISAWAALHLAFYISKVIYKDKEARSWIKNNKYLSFSGALIVIAMSTALPMQAYELFIALSTKGDASSEYIAFGEMLLHNASPDDYHPLDFLIAGLGCLYLSLHAYALAQRYLQPDAKETLELDSRPPVLLLRSFVDDDAPTRPKSYVKRWFRRGATLEEALSTEMSLLGPFVAIGNPDEKLPMLGAMRSYFSDETWQGAIDEWIKKSRLIVLVSGRTKWVDWEIKTIINNGALNKLLIVFPPNKSSNLKSRQELIQSGKELGLEEELDETNDRESRQKFLSTYFRDTRWYSEFQNVDLSNVLMIFFKGVDEVRYIVSENAAELDYDMATMVAANELLDA